MSDYKKLWPDLELDKEEEHSDLKLEKEEEYRNSYWGNWELEDVDAYFSYLKEKGRI